MIMTKQAHTVPLKFRSVIALLLKCKGFAAPSIFRSGFLHALHNCLGSLLLAETGSPAPEDYTGRQLFNPPANSDQIDR
jgi:hypothetical protein